MRKIIVLLPFLVFSCTLIRMDDSIDPGNSYRYIQETPQAIIYHSGDKYKGVGVEIVPPIVLSYKFNEHYIIAKSREMEERPGDANKTPIHYWIVDKTLKRVPPAPLDSVTFYRRLVELDVKLNL